MAAEEQPPAWPGLEPPASGAEPPPLELVRRLCQALSSEGIRYCHWKSNDTLDRSASGDKDLDLLIARRDAQRFAAVLRRLGFKAATSPPKKAVPGVLHSYGLDQASGKLVHVHAQYHLVLGDDMTKNYRLPIEEAYLGSVHQAPPFRVPAPEFEFVVFVLRMVLKHSTVDAILSSCGALSTGEARELKDLRSRVDVQQARKIVDEYLPFIDQALWGRCVRCIGSVSSPWFRIHTAHRLQRSLVAYARRPPTVDMGLRLWRRGKWVLDRRVLGRPPQRNRLNSGGALIAIVGGDGAGKSTAVDELHTWLSKEFAAVKIHLGRPPLSRTSSTVQGLWRVAFRRRSARARQPARPGSDGQGLGLRALPTLTRRLMRSRDRFLLYVRARRFASTGGIVISDRYPLPQITLMDGPVASTAHAQRRNPLISYMTALENRYYRQIVYPDVLIVLRVDPDVAVERTRGEEDRDFARRRSEEVWGVDWHHLPAVVVDASRSKDEVLSEIKSLVWSML